MSNLGGYGTEEFTAVLNPPQAAILAVGAARPEAVVDGGEVGVATVLRVTLTVDHRPVDGALAARWMAAFLALLEAPAPHPGLSPPRRRGEPQMPDAEVETALRHWAPRLIQNGVDYNDMLTHHGSASTPGTAGCRSGTGPPTTRPSSPARPTPPGTGSPPGRRWRRASVNRHFGKFVWMVDLDLAREATLRSVEETRTALARLDPTAERLEIPVDGGTAYANLRRPAGVEHPPYVVVIPGLDSTKEEFFYFEQSFLDRGMATVALDGPGQGETGLAVPIRPDYETAVSPLLDLLRQAGRPRPRPGRDRRGQPRRLLRAPGGRVRAAVPRGGRDQRAVLLRRHVGRAAADDARDVRGEVRRGRRRRGPPDRVHPGPRRRARPDRGPGPLRHRQAGPAHPLAADRTAGDETPHGTFVCFPDGNHGVSNLPSKARPLIADWMADRLGA